MPPKPAPAKQAAPVVRPKAAGPPAASKAGPAQGGAGVGAHSVKVERAGGADVVTVATSTHATAGEPDLIVELVGEAGFTVKDGRVDTLAESSSVIKKGVKVGWAVVKINDKPTKADADVKQGLAAARKTGKPYRITFRVRAVTPQEQAQPPPSQLQQEQLPQQDEEINRLAAEEEARQMQQAEEAERARKALEEEQERRKQEEEAAAAAAAASAEAEMLAAQARRNGKARFKYEMYDQEFEIVNGSLTQEALDEEFSFTYVMPGCLVHLSELAPAERTALENKGQPVPPFVMERPQGAFFGLEVGKTYWCYVEQNAQQLRKDQDATKARMAQGAAAAGAAKRDDGRGFESCSCIYGNPCVDEYGCKDWSNRYAIAKKNGWKGF